MAATIAQHIAARDDEHLHKRLVAAAEKEGVPGAAAWVTENRGMLVCADVAGSSLAEVHAYAVGQQTPPPLPPGADPSYVTDALLADAVRAVRGAS